jgi:hypothetical protein
MYADALSQKRAERPEVVFVLPGHNLPFVGFGTR